MLQYAIARQVELIVLVGDAGGRVCKSMETGADVQLIYQSVRFRYFTMR